jgi:large subunit ribosomal protein L9
MKIILLKDVVDLGEIEDVVEVSEGYARNFLFPRKFAKGATPAALVAWEKRKVEKEKQQAARRAEFEELAKKLGAEEIDIKADAGEGGRLFGSVTAQDIAQAAQELFKVEIDKKKIELQEPIKAVGDYVVSLKLFKGISAKLKIKVSAQ